MAPRTIFWLDETHETPNGYEVNLVTEDEPGYSTTGFVVATTDFTYAKAVVTLLNEKLFDVAPSAAVDILMSSMFPKVT